MIKAYPNNLCVYSVKIRGFFFMAFVFFVVPLFGCGLVALGTPFIARAGSMPIQFVKMKKNGKTGKINVSLRDFCVRCFEPRGHGFTRLEEAYPLNHALASVRRFLRCSFIGRLSIFRDRVFGATEGQRQVFDTKGPVGKAPW